MSDEFKLKQIVLTFEELLRVLSVTCFYSVDFGDSYLLLQV